MKILQRAFDHARDFLEQLPERPVVPRVDPSSLRAALGGPVPGRASDPLAVIDALARDGGRGIVASAGPRYFGFVTGGSLPVAVAADWIATVWDQNAALHVMSPAVSAIEQIAGRWLLDLLSLPHDASVGFVTGAHTANVTALAAARHEVLRRAGWDVEEMGLQGAPRIAVLAGAEAHSSIGAACRMIGLGASTIVRVGADEQGRMRADLLAAALECTSGPRIVCAQAGNVNTGASDPFVEIIRASHHHGAWVHVDGAFGLWAAAAPSLKHQVAGVEGADSWTTDGHKWLNVPYDSGIVITAHPAAHRAAMSQTAAYLIPAAQEERDGMDWVPEASRRARAVPVYAVLRQLGREGIADLVERCCRLAVRMADRLRADPSVAILNDVVLNQVLVRVDADDGTNITPAVIAAVQGDGTCWCGGTSWQGQPAMRISVSNWSPTERDVDRAAQAILRARDNGGGGGNGERHNTKARRDGA
jgi:glutamate/tyrosine decarboxylase-like PLP-dependent enzyme